MKLTIKDKEFLERLKCAMDEKGLFVELKTCGVRRLVLRQNYGDRIEKDFRMTRQGVRWRFQRLFNEIYVSAYETIYWIESQLGTALRQDALAIARQRIQERKSLDKIDERAVYRRENGD